MCEKIKQPKLPKSTPSSKKCPKGKELNPITKRCIKKCKDGEIRNVKTRMCEKIKQPKPPRTPSPLKDSPLPPRTPSPPRTPYLPRTPQTAFIHYFQGTYSVHAK